MLFFEKQYMNQLFKYQQLFILIGITLTMACTKEDEAKKLNFIVFIADDISWNDFGCYGNKEVQTPNIDRIASEGVKFTNVYLMQALAAQAG